MRTPTLYAVALVALSSLAACDGGAVPTPAVDASAGAADAGPVVATICANLRRLNCGGARCEADVEATFNAAPARCGAQRDAYFACAARSTATGCLSNDATFLQCAALNEELARCAGTADAGAADGPEPPDPPRPFDAGGAACPAVSGRFEATGEGEFTGCPSGTFTLARSAEGGAPCRYGVSFVTATSSYALSAAHLDVSDLFAITGEATVTERDGTRVGQLSGTFLEEGAVALVRLTRGTDVCTWNLMRLP